MSDDDLVSNEAKRVDAKRSAALTAKLAKLNKTSNPFSLPSRVQRDVLRFCLRRVVNDTFSYSNPMRGVPRAALMMWDERTDVLGDMVALRKYGLQWIGRCILIAAAEYPMAFQPTSFEPDVLRDAYLFAISEAFGLGVVPKG